MKTVIMFCDLLLLTIVKYTYMYYNVEKINFILQITNAFVYVNIFYDVTRVADLSA